MGFVAFLIPLFVILVLAGILYDQNRRHTQETHWQLLAHSEAGLTFTPGGLFSSAVLHGELDGVSVHVDILTRQEGETGSYYTQVWGRVPVVLPAGLRITPEGLGTTLVKMVGGQDIQVGDVVLDDRARIQGDSPEDIRGLFADPALRRVFLDLFGSSRYNRLEDGKVILEKPGRHGEEVRGMLRTVVAISRALADARLRPWQALTVQHPGLSIALRDTRLLLEGQAEGVAVHGRADLRLGRTELRVEVPASLPPGLVVSSGRLEGALKLGDPVLDSAVSVRGASSEAVRALLRDDALRGDLLSVLHAWPGSRIENNSVVMLIPSASPPALAEHLRDALLLAHHLARRADPQVSAAAQRVPPQRERS